MAGVPQAKIDGELSPALKLFLEARLAEVSGDYSTALERYSKALDKDPGSSEIRISYAALLLDVRMIDRALEVLPPAEGLDWYGQRTRALILASAAARQPQRMPEATAALRAALAIRPEDPTVELNLAQILVRTGNLKEADEIYERLRKQRPGNPQLLMLHAGVLRDLGRSDEALALYKRCADDPLAGASCQQSLVDLLVSEGRSAEAGHAMLAWLADDDLDGLLKAAALLGDGGEAEAALPVVRRVLAADPDSDRARQLEAMLLISAGRLDDAAQRLTELLHEHKDDLKLLLTLAWVQARRGDLDAARRRIDEAWKKAGEDASTAGGEQVCLTAARVELVAGKPLVARTWLERLGPTADTGEERVQLLAQTYRAPGQWQEGVAALLRLEPHLEGIARSDAVAAEAEFRMRLKQPEARPLLERLLGDKNVDVVILGLDALQRVEKWSDLEKATVAALERFPGNRDVLFLRAAALERLGRTDDAAGTFQEILAADPDDAAAANYLGYMWADAGVHLDEALRLISHAVELDPTNDAYLDSLGWVHFRLGHLAEAETWMRRAVSLGGRDGTLLAHLGEILAARGQRDEARALLLRALDLGTEHTDRVRALLAELGSTKPGE